MFTLILIFKWIHYNSYNNYQKVMFQLNNLNLYTLKLVIHLHLYYMKFVQHKKEENLKHFHLQL